VETRTAKGVEVLARIEAASLTVGHKSKHNPKKKKKKNRKEGKEENEGDEINLHSGADALTIRDDAEPDGGDWKLAGC